MNGFIFILIALVLPLLSLGCDIKAKLKFDEKISDGFARFKFYNKTYGPVYAFKKDAKKNFSQHFNIKGLFCNLEPTVLETFKDDPRSGGKVVKSTSAFIEGAGVIEYEIAEGLVPFVATRIGVVCGFGDCGPRG